MIAALGYIVAALVAGLWWGERGRRLAAERWKVQGTPEKPVARVLPGHTEPEGRLEAQFSEETITRGCDNLRTLYTEAGISISEADIRAQVEAMLYQDDPVLPG